MFEKDPGDEFRTSIELADKMNSRIILGKYNENDKVFPFFSTRLTSEIKISVIAIVAINYILKYKGLSDIMTIFSFLLPL